MQSKRRAHALIIDHLTPPMTTADGYGELAQLMHLVSVVGFFNCTRSFTFLLKIHEHFPCYDITGG